MVPPAARLTQEADSTFAALAQDKHLRGRDREGFIAGLARHLDAVNHLHPFREGNGRTQRIFFSQLSGRAGYLLRWDRISAEENAAASRVGAAAWPPLLERMTEPLPDRTRTRADTRETAGLQIAIQALAATVDQLAQPSRSSETPTPGRHPAGNDDDRRHDRGSGPHLHP